MCKWGGPAEGRFEKGIPLWFRSLGKIYRTFKIDYLFPEKEEDGSGVSGDCGEEGFEALAVQDHT